MRRASILLLACMVMPLPAQQVDGPASEKAQKTYSEALDYLKKRMDDAALDSFKKADKQDGGHCLACQKNMIKYGVELQEWKIAETAAEEPLAEDEPGVRGEHEVRQPRLRLHLLNDDTERPQRVAQRLPLAEREFADGPEGAVHPRVDLVLDPVMIRRAHEDSRLIRRRHNELP